jgi:5-methylthioadenosine/S-adenosylhomocysteine deaminase
MGAIVAAPLIDRGGGPGVGLRDAALRSLEDLSGRGPAVQAALAPHAIYTVGTEGLRWVAGLAAERDLPVHIHLSETEEEVRGCLAEHGTRPAHYLDSVGLLGPRTLLAHGVWLDDSELDLIAERGSTLVTNPVANLKLAVGGPFPYRATRERGIGVGLGTDGPGSNNSLDLFADAKAFALLHKQDQGDPSAVTAEEAWRIATGRDSALLAGAAPAMGASADFLLVRWDSPELVPGELVANLVYAASGAVVDTTVVRGTVLMRRREVDGAAEVVERARERAHTLWRA